MLLRAARGLGCASPRGIACCPGVAPVSVAWQRTTVAGATRACDPVVRARCAGRGAVPAVAQSRGLCTAAPADVPASVSTPVRVRYAPSPTGFLHLGGLRTALYNYLLAKRSGGQFLLRIEDTDQARQVDGSIEGLIRALQWCSVNHDEGPGAGGEYGPYIQSQRLPVYKEAADRLLESGHAYHCFCSSERLDALRTSQKRRGLMPMYDRACLSLTQEEVQAKRDAGESFTIRFKMPSGASKVEDAVVGTVTFPHNSIDDQVLLKSDGFPTYHLASVVDDHEMRITHVIRGQEWLASTPKHVALYEAMGWEVPNFAHLPLLLNPDKSKLSKRHGDVAVEDFQGKGYLPEAVNNFVALLGWNPKTTQEVFTMDELIEQFSLEHVHKANCVALHERLDWLNGQHVKMLAKADPCRLERLAAPHVQRAVSELAQRTGQADVSVVDALVLDPDSDVGQALVTAVALQHERVTVLPDFGDLCAFFFVRPDWSSVHNTAAWKSVYTQQVTDAILKDVGDAIEAIAADEFATQAGPTLKKVSKAHKVGLKKVLMPVRLVLTGMDVGATLGEIMAALGQAEVLARLRTGADVVLRNSSS